MIRQIAPVFTLFTVFIAVCVFITPDRSVGRTTSTPADSTDSIRTSSRERNTTPTRRTDRTIDSLTKPVRIMVANKVGCDTGGYVPWPHWSREQIGQLVQDGFIIVRDSVIELLDTLCFKWYVRVAKSPTDRPRIWLQDTCRDEESCIPLIGDTDREYHNACDSIRITSYDPWTRTYYHEDPYTGLRKDLVIEVDTMWVPIVFQIYTNRDSTVSTYPDSSIKWLHPNYYMSTLTAFPLGASYSVGYVAWNTLRGTTSTGGEVNYIDDRATVVLPDKCMMVRWITNPATRSGGNNKTKLSLYTAPIIEGGAPQLNSPLQITHLRIFEIDDNTLGNNTGQVLLTVTVWLYYVTHL